MFSSFFLPASLPNNSAPSLSNYTKSPILTESQLHQLSEDQHKLAAEMTLCALFIMYICVCVELGGTGVGRNWCERFTAEGNPAWPSFQSVSLVTVAFRKLSENEGGKCSTAQTGQTGNKILFMRLDRMHEAHMEDNSSHWSFAFRERLKKIPHERAALGFWARIGVCKYYKSASLIL